MSANPAAETSPVSELPNWNLNDLYPGPDAPEVKADLERAGRDAEAFAVAYEGRLANLPGQTLAAAISAYEQIEEILGRIMS